MPSCIHWDGYYQKEGRKGKEWKVHVFGENMEKLEPVALLVRMWNVQLNSMETLQKVKNRIMIWLSNFTSGNIPKRTEPRSWIHTYIFICTEVSFTTAKQGSNSSVHQQVNGKSRCGIYNTYNGI